MKISGTITTLLAGGALALTGLMAAKPADAATLAQYTFTGNSLASSDTDPNSTATAFSGGAGLAVRTSSFRGDPTPSVAVTFRDLLSTSQTTALANGSYYQFTVAPTAGNRVKFTSLNFGTNVGPTGGKPPGVGTYFVRTSADGFTNTLASYTQPSTPPPNGNVPFTTRNVNLSGLNSPFFTTPLSFRIYEYDNGSTFDGGGLRVDNVIVQGDVAPVPELSTGLLLALAMGGMGLMAMRRKKGGSAAFGRAPLAI